MSAMENKMPIVLCRKLPLTSLGELQKAPKAKAMAISISPNCKPIIIGKDNAIPIIIALEKSVLFKNCISSLKFVEMAFVRFKS